MHLPAALVCIRHSRGVPLSCNSEIRCSTRLRSVRHSSRVLETERSSCPRTRRRGLRYTPTSPPRKARRPPARPTPSATRHDAARMGSRCPPRHPIARSPVPPREAWLELRRLALLEGRCQVEPHDVGLLAASASRLPRPGERSFISAGGRDVHGALGGNVAGARRRKECLRQAAGCGKRRKRGRARGVRRLVAGAFVEALRPPSACTLAILRRSPLAAGKGRP